MQVFCQIFSYENESFSGAVRVRKLESWKVGKLESVLWTGSENGYVCGKHDSTIRLLIEF